MSKPNITVSVIVTIHNAEKYLAECLDSVCNQTLSDIEILCIDGGSTDNSPAIMLEYQQRDSRIRIINDPNTSYGHKVNVGIEQAAGEYIAVLESDDMYEPYMLEKLYEIAKLYHPDFVNGEYNHFFDIEGTRFVVPHKLYKKQAYNCLIENAAHPENMEVMDRFWTGIFNKKFLDEKQIRLNESPGASFQDMSFRFLTSVLADTVYHVDLPVYRYRMDNPGSSMKDPSKTVVIVDEHDYLQRELEKRNITEPYIWYLRYYWKYMDFHGNIQRLEGPGRQALLERYQQELEKDLPNIPEYSEEKYPYTSKDIILDKPEIFQAQIEEEFQAYKRGNAVYHELYGKLVKAQRIVIFGCGNIGVHMYELLHSLWERVVCYTDNAANRWGTTLNGVPVLSPEDAVKAEPGALYMIANKYHGAEIRKQLQGLGIAEDQIADTV